MPMSDDEIARAIERAANSGELRRAPSYGKPIRPDRDRDATPPELRLSMKILKDAGAAPPEIAMFHERARLRRLLEATADARVRAPLQLRLAELEQKIALRLESLRARRRV